ncbi:30S ribosomal protein S16 [Patescibacteria group bacterium]
MLVIRLTRVGKKKQPTYRIVVQEKHRDPWGTSVEILGHYNPRTKEIEVKGDRVKHWISKGAQPSPTMNNLLITNKIIEGDKLRATTKDIKAPEPTAPAEEPKAEEPVPSEVEGTPAEEATEAPAEEPEEKKEDAT